MTLRLSKDALRAAFAKLRGCLTEGLNDEETCERMGLSWEEVAELKRRFYDHEAEILRSRSTEHSFVRYAIEQRQCMKDLDRVIEDYQAQKNVSGYVGAVRAKSEILERVMKTGLELGLVKRLASGSGLAAGEAIKNMSNVEFRAFIVQEINVFNQVRMEYGEQNILDIAQGPIHRSVAKQKFPVKAHARTKVYGGRRVVKGEDS